MKKVHNSSLKRLKVHFCGNSILQLSDISASDTYIPVCCVKRWIMRKRRTWNTSGGSWRGSVADLPSSRLNYITAEGGESIRGYKRERRRVQENRPEQRQSGEELKASGIQTTDLRRTSCRASSSSLWVRAHLTDTFTAALLVCKVKTVLNTNHHHHLSEGTEARGFVVDTFVQMWNNLHRIIARPLIGLQLHLPWQHL